MARKVDRRVRRTQDLLQDALLSLIREKGFEALSVQDIIDRANVGRATFYAHFDNKQDLLLSGFDGLRGSLRELQRQALSRGGSVDERLFAFSHELFAHANGHRDVFRAMVGDKSVAVIQQVFRKMLVDLIRDDVKAMTSRNGSASMPNETVVQFVGCGLFGLLMWWMESKRPLGVEEVNALFRPLAMAAVTAELG